MSEPDLSAQDAIAIGRRLAGARVVAAQPARSGGNNRVFRLKMAEGPPLALKHYPSDGLSARCSGKSSAAESCPSSA
jgi:hypothetical protein